MEVLMQWMPYIGMVVTWLAGYYMNGRFKKRTLEAKTNVEEATATVQETDTYIEFAEKVQKQLVELNLKHIENQKKITDLVIKNNQYLTVIEELKNENSILLSKIDELGNKIDELNDELKTKTDG